MFFEAPHAKFGQTPPPEVPRCFCPALPVHHASGAGLRATVYSFDHDRERQFGAARWSSAHRQFVFSMRQDDRFAASQTGRARSINAMHADDRAQIVSIGGPARLLTEMISDNRICAPQSRRLSLATTPTLIPNWPACFAPLRRASRPPSTLMCSRICRSPPCRRHSRT